MALGVCEALWLRLLLKDLGYPPMQPIPLYCDNKVACDIAHNLVQHDRTKHVEVVNDMRSTSSYFTFVGGYLVTWKSKKHNVVA